MEKVRYFRVKDRTSGTVIPLIKKYVSSGSLVWTNGFSTYKALEEHGYQPQTVDHLKNYVDPYTQAHIQAVERSWIEAKEMYRRIRGNRRMLQSHLDEIAYRKLRRDSIKDGTILQVFLTDMGRAYCA